MSNNRSRSLPPNRQVGQTRDPFSDGLTQNGCPDNIVMSDTTYLFAEGAALNDLIRSDSFQANVTFTALPSCCNQATTAIQHLIEWLITGYVCRIHQLYTCRYRLESTVLIVDIPDLDFSRFFYYSKQDIVSSKEALTTLFKYFRKMPNLVGTKINIRLDFTGCALGEGKSFLERKFAKCPITLCNV